MSLYVASTKHGMKVNTVTRLMAMPFASARPRSGPMRYCMSTSARKPMTVVRPLARIDEVEAHRASTMAVLASGASRRHSSKRCSRNTE